MTARLLTMTLLAVGCTSTEETPDADTDEVVVEPDCDYAAFAGDWEGVVRQDAGDLGILEADTQFTVIAASMTGETAGTASFTSDFSGSAESCFNELVCTGETQVGWRVLRSRLLPESSELCARGGFAFLRPEDDGSLTVEGSPSEFGQRLSTGSMQPVN